MKCQVKRSNIPTYEEAERELEFILAITDTDEETSVTESKQASQKDLNLNVLVEQLCANSPVCKEPDNQPIFTVPDNSSVITVNNEVNDSSQIILTSSGNEILGTYCLMNESQNNIINETQESNDINKTFNNISLVLENQNKMVATILDNQNKMMHKMASISIQIDNIQMQLNNHDKTEFLSLGLSNTRAENRQFSIKPINSIEELKKMESCLSEKPAREQLKETYSIVCAGGKGINCAYMLIDMMFTRDFLCKCSWSGSSRSDGIKISLKCYKNIVSFFWEMVFVWDCTYTIKQNEDFFKSVLKNANKRKKAKLERASTTRKRVKLDKTHKEIDHIDQILNKPKENISSNSNNSENKENVASSSCTVQDSGCVDNEENVDEKILSENEDESLC